MIDTFNFSINPASAALGPISGNAYRHQPGNEPWAKPVYAIHTHGWLVIELPRDLVKVVGRSRLQMTQCASVLLYAHFETEQAIYQLHVVTRVQLNLRE